MVPLSFIGITMGLALAFNMEPGGSDSSGTTQQTVKVSSGLVNQIDPAELESALSEQLLANTQLDPEVGKACINRKCYRYYALKIFPLDLPNLRLTTLHYTVKDVLDEQGTNHVFITEKNKLEKIADQHQIKLTFPERLTGVGIEKAHFYIRASWPVKLLRKQVEPELGEFKLGMTQLEITRADNASGQTHVAYQYSPKDDPSNPSVIVLGHLDQELVEPAAKGRSSFKDYYSYTLGFSKPVDQLELIKIEETYPVTLEFELDLQSGQLIPVK